MQHRFVCNGDPNSNTGSAADPARLGTDLPGDAEISLEDAVRAGAACKRLFGREAAKSVLSNEPRRVSGQLSALSSFLSNSLAWARCSRARPFASFVPGWWITATLTALYLLSYRSSGPAARLCKS